MNVSVKNLGNGIKNVKINDYVNSENGFIKVLNYFDNGKKDCFKIITNNNLELIITKDHKIEMRNYEVCPAFSFDKSDDLL